MGMMLEFLGEHDEAMRWQEKALALAESRGDPYLRACAQNCLAYSLWRAARPSGLNNCCASHCIRVRCSTNHGYGATALEALAWIAGSRHDPRRAVVLLAAASAISAAAGALLNPISEMVGWHDECERRAREELGAAEFQTAWAQGDALSLSEATAFAVTDTATPAHTVMERFQTT